MPELEPQAGQDMTARLVEQLTKTNERLERLEAALRERSMLPSIQQEPAHGDTAVVSSQSRENTASQSQNGSRTEAVQELNARAEAHFRRGVELCQSGDYAGALSAWHQVLELQPDNPYAMANIGIVYTEQARWQEARDIFVRVLSIQPSNAEAYYGLGMADAQLGNYAGAVAAWENTLRLQPDNNDARYNLALVRQRMTQTAEQEVAAAGIASAVPAASEAAPAVSMAAEPARTEAEAAGPARTSEPQSVFDAAPSGAQSALAGPGEQAAEAARDVVSAVAQEPVGVAEHGVAPEPSDGQGSKPSQSSDWKRLDPSSGNGRTVRPGRGASRPARPTGRPTGRPALVVIGACIVVASILLYNYRTSIAHAIATGRMDSAVAPSHATEKPSGGMLTTTAPKPAVGSGVSVYPAVLGASAPEAPGGQATPTPRRPGLMQVQLAKDVTGRFRYWFVSKSDRAAAMRWMPRADAAGVVRLYIPPEYNQPGTQLRILNVSQGKVARIPVIDSNQPAVFVTPNVGANLLKNSDFAQGITEWKMESNAPARASVRVLDALSTPPKVTGRALHFDVTAVAPQPWNIQFLQPGLNLNARSPYVLSFWARSDRSRAIHLDAVLDKPDWHRVARINGVKLTPAWQKYTLHFTTDQTEPSHTQISFILGETTGPVELAGVGLRPSLGADVASRPRAAGPAPVRAADFN